MCRTKTQTREATTSYGKSIPPAYQTITANDVDAFFDQHKKSNITDLLRMIGVGFNKKGKLIRVAAF